MSYDTSIDATQAMSKVSIPLEQGNVLRPIILK